MKIYKTEQRKRIQDVFENRPHEMLSAKEIETMLGSEAVSISAVYRNLAELETAGLVRRCTKRGSREACYQYTGSRGCKDCIHLTCKKCGTTIHMAYEDTEALVRNASKYKDFSVDKAETVLFGLCGACRKS